MKTMISSCASASALWTAASGGLTASSADGVASLDLVIAAQYRTRRLMRSTNDKRGSQKGACLRSRSKSVRLAGCPQDRGALLGHFLLFVRRDDQNGYVGPGRGDVKSARFIGVGVAGDAQPSETRADAGAHIGLVLANPAGEHQRVNSRSEEHTS